MAENEDKHDPDELVGTVVDDKYELLDVLGQGAAGVVYLARNRLINRQVAIKILFLHPSFPGYSRALKRFQREARISGALGHENIIDIMDMGTLTSGAPYIVMEHLEGEVLGDRLVIDGTLEVEDAVDIMIQALDALAAVHAAEVIHRDLKPDNIFLTTRKRISEPDRTMVKLLDFGVSKLLSPEESANKLTATGTVIGTPLYMAPEQMEGEAGIDHRIDIYSAGVILYEVLTGKRPFKANSLMNLLSKLCNEDPTPPSMYWPDIPADLERVILKAISKNPEDRFATAEEFIKALLPFAKGAPVDPERRKTQPSIAPEPALTSTAIGSTNLQYPPAEPTDDQPEAEPSPEPASPAPVEVQTEAEPSPEPIKEEPETEPSPEPVSPDPVDEQPAAEPTPEPSEAPEEPEIESIGPEPELTQAAATEAASPPRSQTGKRIALISAVVLAAVAAVSVAVWATTTPATPTTPPIAPPVTERAEPVPSSKGVSISAGADSVTNAPVQEADPPSEPIDEEPSREVTSERPPRTKRTHTVSPSPSPAPEPPAPEPEPPAPEPEPPTTEPHPELDTVFPPAKATPQRPTPNLDLDFPGQ